MRFLIIAVNASMLINCAIHEDISKNAYTVRHELKFMKEYIWSWLKKKFAEMKVFLLKLPKLVIGTLLYGFAFSIFAVFIIILIFIMIINLSTVIKPTIPEDLLQYTNLSSSVLSFIVTTAYVVFTYRILKTTEDNTKQSEKVVQQTAKAQKIAYIERKLEHFYLPIQTAIERFDIDRMILGFQDPEMTTPQHIPYLYFEIINTWWGFRTDYDKAIPFTYLASDEAKKALKDFTYIFELNRLFAKRYTTSIKEDTKIYTEINALYQDGWGDMFNADVESVFLCYKSLSDAIEKDIIAISNNLAELVNL